jgi:RNA polymerase sigma-70 factor (ECF subfamily)
MSEGWAPVSEPRPVDEEHFWQLFEPSFRSVHRFLRQRCDQATAEDLTQEVFLELARRFRRGDDVAALSTGWLITVARSRLIDHVRRQDRQQRKLRLAWSMNQRSAEQAEARDGFDAEADLGARTELALRTLSDTERCALLLHHLDGLSITEVATSLGRSPRATESLLARARRKFRAAFAEVRP